MIRYLLAVLLAIPAGIAGLCAQQQPDTGALTKQSAGGYRLVWSDEFNRDGAPDTADWNYETGLLRNHEYQWYQPGNVYCSNGMLVIEARRQQQPNPLYVSGSHDWRQRDANIHYTSASINTSGRHSWLYGRFIMRGKINIDSGLWPAWWMLGVSGNWPAGGEIDIMEYYRDRVLANIACAGPGDRPQWFSKFLSADSLGGKAWADKFHTWQMDWDPDSISLYLDDRLVNKVPLSMLQNKDNTGTNPFNHPLYMLLNLAIGGDNGGDPVTTNFPTRFEVDYVRVFQKK